MAFYVFHAAFFHAWDAVAGDVILLQSRWFARFQVRSQPLWLSRLKGRGAFRAETESAKKNLRRSLFSLEFW